MFLRRLWPLHHSSPEVLETGLSATESHCNNQFMFVGSESDFESYSQRNRENLQNRLNETVGFRNIDLDADSIFDQTSRNIADSS